MIAPNRLPYKHRQNVDQADAVIIKTIEAVKELLRRVDTDQADIFASFEVDKLESYLPKDYQFIVNGLLELKRRMRAAGIVMVEVRHKNTNLVFYGNGVKGIAGCPTDFVNYLSYKAGKGSA